MRLCCVCALVSCAALALVGCGDDAAPAASADNATTVNGASRDAGADLGSGADAGEGDAAPGQDAASDVAEDVADDAPSVRAECQRHTFTHAGVVRGYILCAPEPASEAPTPVVLGFHGGGGNAGSWRETMAMDEAVAAQRLVMVYMQGCRRNQTDCSDFDEGRYIWNVDKPGALNDAPDKGYVDAVVARLTEEHGLSVDAARVYGMGHSLGGMMLYALACDRPGLFAAIAPISAAPSDMSCALSGALSIYHVHGAEDPNVPLLGCCSEAQADPDSPDHLPGCGALAVCANTSNWWPPVRSGSHPFAEVTGLDAISEALAGCVVGDATANNRPLCKVGGGCASGRSVELCAVPGQGHGLGELEDVFGVREYVLDRFRL